MSVTVLPPPKLGSLGEALIEAYAWLHSPATIAHEIAHLVQLQAQGDRSEAIAVQLAEWRAIRDCQRRLLGEERESA
jgi:hypothetical protein